jgi:acetyl esterase
MGSEIIGLNHARFDAVGITMAGPEDSGYAAIAAQARAQNVAPGDPTRQLLSQARLANGNYYRAMNGSELSVARVFDMEIPGLVGPLRLRVFHPKPGLLVPVIVYFHGGGYVLNGLDTHDRVMRTLALESGAAVVGVGYSLAPEHVWPTQLEEARLAIRAIAQLGRACGLDSGRIVLAGDSAGAHLALASALALRQDGPKISQLLLAYGMYERSFDTPSHRLFGGGEYGLTTERMRWFWHQAIPVNAPLSEPLHADLSGLPPTLVITAGLDCLRDDSVHLAAALEQAGVVVTSHSYGDVRHSFLQFSRFLPSAQIAIKDMATAARTRFDRVN